MQTPKASKIGNRFKEFRESLGLSQLKFGEKLSVTGDLQRKIAFYENEAKNIPSEVQQRAARLFGLNLQWLATGEGPMILPVKEVPPDTIGGRGWIQLPEQRQAEAVRRAMEEIDRKGPTDAQVWAARQIAENALRGRDLYGRASPEQKEFLVDWIASQLALESSPDVLERGVRIVLDGFEAADRQQSQ